jgi:hypothetical protein
MPDKRNSWYLAENTEKKDFDAYISAVPNRDAIIKTAPFRAHTVYIITQQTAFLVLFGMPQFK